MLHKKLIIIGSGPAGYTAAIYASRANLKPILITGMQKGGQLITTNQIENWPGRFEKTTGLELMHDMEQHAIKLKTIIVPDQVLKIKFSYPKLRIFCEEHQYTSYALIIATGSSPRYLNLPSEKKFLGKGISTCATCDGFFYKDKIVAVVGGGNTAIEETLYLSNIASKVYLIHRRNVFKAEKILVNRLKEKIKYGKIILYTPYTIKDIYGNTQGISYINIVSNNHVKSINISALFVAIGSIPNTQIFENNIKTQNGYIQTNIYNNQYHTQTNIPGVFAAGDVSDYIYKQAITSSASGCMAALDAERYLNCLNFKN
ncbi:thioredoxin-disulfide reductase [Buchnera aphidicola (Stegophylla sp.)]|uniref:Thioredoxin reductase n=1 Tax=Buchnera aphidicola (Stegophylla sp.) TaxID=2315800 RepID=A0A4D6YKN3_9GAMM|nr:thioredoxin-disulfide reductase [Buchnera aphidicola (Stegophylla sp.)]